MRKLQHWLVFAMIAIFSLGPLVVLLGYAVGPGWRFPDVIPQQIDLRSFAYLGSQTGKLGTAMLTSVGYSLATVGLTFALCIIPARHLARCDFRGRTLVEGLLLAPALVPPMTFSMGVQVAFIKMGLVDSFPGVVLVLATFSYPYMLRALVAGYQTLSPAYALTAQGLGAGRMTVLTRVELPLLLPSVIAGGSVVFLVAFSEYFLVFLIGGGRVPSYATALFPFLTSSDRSMGAILTLLFLLVPLFLFFAIELAVTRRCRSRGMA